MLKTFKVQYVLSNSNYLIEINWDKPLEELILFRKILPGFNSASVNSPQNMQESLRRKIECGVHVLVGIWQQHQHLV